MLLPDGVVWVLDCGMVQRVDDELREAIEDLLLAAVHGDAKTDTNAVWDLCTTRPTTSRERLQSDVSEFVTETGAAQGRSRSCPAKKRMSHLHRCSQPIARNRRLRRHSARSNAWLTKSRESSTTSASRMADVHMMVRTGGRSRAEEEWRESTDER